MPSKNGSTLRAHFAGFLKNLRQIAPHWSELSAYLVELETADAADIFLYWEYRTLLRGWGRAGFQPEYTLAQLNVGEPEVGAALWKRDKGKRRDLRGVEEMEPIPVSMATSGMPMTVTDGNLRLINQFARFSLDGFRAFVCVHPRLGENRDNQWFITERAWEVARERTAQAAGDLAGSPSGSTSMS